MLCLIGIQPAWASQQTLSSQEEQLQEWITYYYLHNDVSEVGDFLKRIQDSQVLKNPSDRDSLFLVFFRRFFRIIPSRFRHGLKTPILPASPKRQWNMLYSYRATGRSSQMSFKKHLKA